MIGTILAERYEIIEKIGSGGSADVYLASDIKLHRKVAVKILSPLYASNRNFVARFKKEAQILARLNDPNIVAVFDWGQFENSYFICMEYVEGLSLSEIIEKQGIINPATAARYSVQICNALEIAHKNNLIHRDIKPQNIIVTSDGTIKITDFGIAKSLLEDNTKTLNILGTSYYISPEQAQGKVLSYSTDLYSLGIVIYEMLTADVPFRGENSIDISLKHINEKPVKPSILVPEIPDRIEKIVLKCLQKDPMKRYESATDLKSDLINFLKGKPLADEEIRENTFSGKKRVTRKIGHFDFPSKISEDKEEFTSDDKEENFPKGSEERKSRKTLVLTWYILFPVLAVFLAISIWSLMSYSSLKNQTEFVKVPHIINMDYLNAEKMLQSINLRIAVEGENFSNNIPEGYIINQNPEEGANVDKDSEIKVIISKGQEEVLSDILPNLTGINIEEGRKILSDLGFYNQELKWEYSDFFQKDIIIKQEPGRFETVSFEEKILLYVSSGKEMIILPDLIGYDFMFASSSLKSLGFELTAEKIPSTAFAPGTVINTFPVPGTELPYGSFIKVFISTSEEMIEIPDITKLNLENAVSILESMGISYETGYTTVMHSIQKNIVLSQYPESGSYITPSEKLLLIIGG
ncbi:MAG TPA: Stk1 family PASTA domain-containing Ser/Thr kinase [Actinobacteria bacterium]|nr:Stk1 family PASTA domain-containing Ser/Thr kinase [Actinomycetota bacterium]